MTTLTKKDEAVGAARGSSEVIEALKQARERVARGWCRQAYARDAAGSAVSYRSARAVEWCSDGALFAVEHEDGRPYAYLRQAIGTQAIHIWNDAPGRTQAEVLAAFDRAIALSEGNAPEAPKEAVAEAPHGPRPEPEMAVWNAAEAEKR